MGPPRRAQIGLDADRFEILIIREMACNIRIAGAFRMDHRQTAAGRGGEGEIDAACEKFGLPDGIMLRRQVLHGEEAGLRVLTQHARYRIRQPSAGGAEPRGLRGIAIGRDFPHGGHFESRQRALHAETARAGLDEMDVGGNAAGEGCQPDAVARPCKSHPLDGGDDRRRFHGLSRNFARDGSPGPFAREIVIDELAIAASARSSGNARHGRPRRAIPPSARASRHSRRYSSDSNRRSAARHR